ncbi:uncharacterized protein LOC132698645 [Cylas formicarius]|uniref:uncharacterized protein LOC132698645 n=1 Tax=Cylas formicarius TaxID=197179 RepID=UPI002958C318|nr:uncharacterized protein LOC132698645 [Cylas formicarius]
MTQRTKDAGALARFSQWCRDGKLTVNPGKMDGVPLSANGNFKYLGEWLDSKLTFQEHIRSRTSSAFGALRACRRAVGDTCFLGPKIMAVAWWSGPKRAAARILLDKLQRLTCLCITGAMKMAPTRTLEALVGVPSLADRVRVEAVRTAVRLASCGLWRDRTFKRDPYNILEGWRGDRGVMDMSSDVMIPEIIFFDKWTFRFPLREEWRKGRIGSWDGLVWHMDRSTMGDLAGAEIFAILMAAREVVRLNHGSTGVFFCSDGRATLISLKSVRTRSLLIKECQMVLRKVTDVRNVTLVWFPGYTGIRDNKAADALAREGSSPRHKGPEPRLVIAPCVRRGAFEAWVRERAVVGWRVAPGMRQCGLRAQRFHLVEQVLNTTATN